MDNEQNSGLHKGLILDGHKLQWHQERVKAWQMGLRIPPITIDCSLTRACNYKCVYCYGQLQQNECKPITRDVIYRFLDDAADIGVKAISFVSDGESTCSPHLEAAIRRGKENGLDMALGTNGYLIKIDKLDEILPNLTYIRFNISAGCADRYSEIHGVPESYFLKVLETIAETVKIKQAMKLPVTIGLQMVTLPSFKDQIIPLARIGRYLQVDYTVFKHCSDDEKGSLGVDYEGYKDIEQTLKQAETYSTSTYRVAVKWSKIMSGGKRRYAQCYGPNFIMQFSGSGLVAPCGMLFNDRYKKYHIGNIAEYSFKEIWQSDRYRAVLDEIGSERFDARTMCGSLCLQHKCNEFLWDLKHWNAELNTPKGEEPQHINFV